MTTGCIVVVSIIAFVAFGIILRCIYDIMYYREKWISTEQKYKMLKIDIEQCEE